MRVHTAKYHRELRHRRRQITLPFGAQRFLALLEGVEGGFAIGAGLLAGMAVATTDRNLLFLTAAITMIVNGANSSAIKYAAEHYTDELDGVEKRNPVKYYLWPAIYEFVAYLVVTAIVLSPLLFVGSVPKAALLSCAATVLVLFAAGYWRGWLMRRNHKVRDGLELSLLAVLIIGVGVVSALALNYIRL